MTCDFRGVPDATVCHLFHHQVCWIFGREIYDSLAASATSPVPIGLVNNNWGGTPVVRGFLGPKFHHFDCFELDARWNT